MPWPTALNIQQAWLTQELAGMIAQLERSADPSTIVPVPFEGWCQQLVDYRSAQGAWLAQAALHSHHPYRRLWAEYHLTEPNLCLCIKRLHAQSPRVDAFCIQEILHTLMRLQRHLQLDQPANAEDCHAAIGAC
jgi:hypothetical protein